MNGSPAPDRPVAPRPPPARLCIGVTGHRETNPVFVANRDRIERAFAQVLDTITQLLAEEARDPGAPRLETPRMHSLLADGADQIAAAAALARGWELVAPLPYGLDLNIAINAHPHTGAEARALLEGAALESGVDAGLRERALRLRMLASRAHLLELADRDEQIAALLLDSLDHPGDRHRATAFAAESSLRVAMAGRLMIEQSELVIAVWDGASYAHVGGTGHTVRTALEMGAPVFWIDARDPEQWQMLSGPESLIDLDRAAAPLEDRVERIRASIRRAWAAAVGQSEGEAMHRTLEHERWRMRSSWMWHGYRRIEALFGAHRWRERLRNLTQTWETPDQIGTGSGAELLSAARALPGMDPEYVARIEDSVLRRFAWADGVSARLSDVYRGGMTSNFLLAALAIMLGMAYLPLHASHSKWVFALIELGLLVFVLAVAIIGSKRRWHGRWFETRRVAEYLRHAPILLLLAVARAPGRWPRGTDTSWPEWCARHAIRQVGLPRLKVTEGYLREALEELLHRHVVRQRDYHIGKAQRLATAHHSMDRFSQALFLLAIVSVTAYLILKAGGVLHWWPKSLAEGSSLAFTFLGVALPTLGGALAGIRYFGDFERFSTISSVTAEKLQGIHERIERLLAGPPGSIDYGQVADLAHATDEVVVSEIESWQSVFGGKHVTIPV
jgi:hypothetical protein